MSKDHLIHANIHRVKEGARVLEDLARFILRDEVLFKETRKLRHSLKATPLRDLHTTDLGGPSFKEENLRDTLPQLVHANSLRIQEALRVLEEFSLDPDDKHKMKTLRFEAYTLYQAFYAKTLCHTQHKKLTGLYLIIDTDLIPLALDEIILIINQSSVRLVQLRSKTLNKRLFLKQAEKFKTKLKPEILFIINDHVDIALDLGDGVHLGQEDYPIERVIKIAPSHFIVGASCHSVEEAKAAEQAGATYLAVGSLFATQSKKNYRLTSMRKLESIRKLSSLPICALGGLTATKLPLILPSKTDMVAMISYLWQNPNPLSMIQNIQAQLTQLQWGQVSS